MTTTRRDESAGVGHGQASERASFQQRLGPHHDVASALALRLLGSHDDAEDAVQEALLKTWRHRELLEQVVDLRAWWLRVVYHQCLDARRRRLTRRAHEHSVPARSVPPPEEGSARREVLAHVRRLLDELPPKQAAVLHLRIFEELDYDTIGRVLGLSPRSARVYLVKARAHLRARLGPEHDVP